MRDDLVPIQKKAAAALEAWAPTLFKAVEELGDKATLANVARHLGMPKKTLENRIYSARSLGVFEVALVPGRLPKVPQEVSVPEIAPQPVVETAPAAVPSFGEKIQQRLRERAIEALRAWEPEVREAVDRLGPKATLTNVAQRLGMPMATVQNRILSAQRLGVFDITLVRGRKAPSLRGEPELETVPATEPEPASPAHTLPQAPATSSGRAFVARFMHRFPVGGESQRHIDEYYPLEGSHGR